MIRPEVMATVLHRLPPHVKSAVSASETRRKGQRWAPPGHRATGPRARYLIFAARYIPCEISDLVGRVKNLVRRAGGVRLGWQIGLSELADLVHPAVGVGPAAVLDAEEFLAQPHGDG